MQILGMVTEKILEHAVIKIEVCPSGTNRIDSVRSCYITATRTLLPLFKYVIYEIGHMIASLSA